MTITARSLDEQLLAQHDHWSRQLLTRIDVALEVGAGTPEESVARAWRSAVHDQPELRLALDASTQPSVVAARRRLQRSVAVAAGVATFDDPLAVAAAAGERFLASVDAARPPGGRRRSRLGSLLHRIWNGAEPDLWPWAT